MNYDNTVSLDYGALKNIDILNISVENILSLSEKTIVFSHMVLAKKDMDILISVIDKKDTLVHLRFDGCTFVFNDYFLSTKGNYTLALNGCSFEQNTFPLMLDKTIELDIKFSEPIKDISFINQLKQLVSLCIYKTMITNNEDVVIDNLDKLEELELIFTYIKCNCFTIKNIDNAEMIFLSTNGFNQVNVDVGNNLRRLDISECNANKVNLNISKDNDSLIELKLNKNNLKSIPNGLHKLKRLLDLHIEDNLMPIPELENKLTTIHVSIDNIFNTNDKVLRKMHAHTSNDNIKNYFNGHIGYKELLAIKEARNNIALGIDTTKNKELLNTLN